MGTCVSICLCAVWTPPHNSIQPIFYLSVSVSVSGSVNTSLERAYKCNNNASRLLNLIIDDFVLYWINSILSIMCWNFLHFQLDWTALIRTNWMNWRQTYWTPNRAWLMPIWMKGILVLRPFHIECQWLIWTSASMLASYLIDWSCNPFLEWLAWFIKKSKKFNHSNITSDITALMQTLSLSEPLNMTYSVELCVVHNLMHFQSWH